MADKELGSLCISGPAASKMVNDTMTQIEAIINDLGERLKTYGFQGVNVSASLKAESTSYAMERVTHYRAR